MSNHTEAFSQVTSGIEITPKRKNSDHRNLSGAVLAIAAARQQHEADQIAIEKSMIDVVTGLPNRNAFERDYPRFLRRNAGGGHLPVGLMMFDLDGLKRVNDELGHSEGDNLLQAFGATATASMRPTDSLYRIGGDEFAMLLTGELPDNEKFQPVFARAVEERFENVIMEEEFPVEGLKLGVSAAFALHRQGESLGELFDRVDTLLRERKVTRYAEHGITFNDHRQLPQAPAEA